MEDWWLNKERMSHKESKDRERLTGGCGVWLSNTQTEKVAELSS